MPSAKTEYRGRFAPTPSGPLHFGSIIAALGSYLDAKSRQGQWLVRLDDLDTPRVRPGAGDKILRSLEMLGLYWDGCVIYQSQRQAAYNSALATLESKGLLFACYCPRSQVKGKRYPGTCRNNTVVKNGQHATRLITDAITCTLEDQVQPLLKQDLAAEIGDFIVRRADGIFAYHLAVVVDDAFQKITHLVRGADLMHSCPRQIYIQTMLGLPTPIYAHLPLATLASGEKISKQNLVTDELLMHKPADILFHCLEFLGQKPDSVLQDASVDEIITWATGNWDLSAVPRQMYRMAPPQFQSG